METIIKLHNPDTGDKREIKVPLNPLHLHHHYETITQIAVEWSAKGYEVLIRVLEEGGAK